MKPTQPLALLVLIATTLLSACAGPRPLRSLDGHVEVELPAGWEVLNGLHEEAQIQAAHVDSENYAIVLSEPKWELAGMSLDEHAEITRRILVHGLEQARVAEGPKARIVGGLPAIQTEIHGRLDGSWIVYVQTTLESERFFHQVLNWTLASRYESNRPTMDSIALSLQER